MSNGARSGSMPVATDVDQLGTSAKSQFAAECEVDEFVDEFGVAHTAVLP